MSAQTYVDVEALRAAVGEHHLLTLLDHYIDDGLSLEHPRAQQVLERAIAAAQGIAEARLGQRYTREQLVVAGQSEAVVALVVDVAIYRLAPSALPQSEEAERRYRQALRDLEAIGKGLLSTGRADPSPAPVHAELQAPRELAGGW